MSRAAFDYLSRLAVGFGQGWTRFWFTPSDPTTLSLVRLLVGVLVVYLHATLAPDLIAFFGSDGLLSWEVIAPIEADAFTFWNYFQSPGELWTVYLVGLVLLVCFAAGWWTRWTSILALIVFLSDINRAVVITSRTECVTAMMMCYLCLAPCGRRFSVDRWLELRRAAPERQPATPQWSTAATIATRLIQIHLSLIVAMMGFSQLSGEVWWSGAGVLWLMARPDSRLVDLSWLYGSPRAIELWTHMIVLFEFAFPLLIWVPLARPLLICLAAVMWGSLALLTGETTFALALFIASLSFVSPDWLRGRRQPTAAQTLPQTP
ncbi:MAG TPA: hypothetical protein VHV08_17550 [Pirellulales bacterium]|nr:hypothetical protein [Pirellulales bacterium]